MYKRILFATDLSKPQHDLCQQAVNIASHFNSELTLLHVIDLPQSVQYAQALGFAEFNTAPTDEGALVLATLADEFNIPKERQIIDVGRAKFCIPETAKKLAIDLLLLGHSRDNDAPHVFGSLTQTVMEHVPCDVMILKRNSI